MIFHMHKKEIPNFSLKLGNTNIEKVDDCNYLGLTVDTNLNWKKHTEKVANRCSKKLATITIHGNLHVSTHSKLNTNLQKNVSKI